MVYPMPPFEKNHKPKPLVDGENRTADERRMHNERVKVFIGREYMMRENIEKLLLDHF